MYQPCPLFCQLILDEEECFRYCNSRYRLPLQLFRRQFLEQNPHRFDDHRLAVDVDTH